MMKELRDHSEPCEHESHEEWVNAPSFKDGGYTIHLGAHLFYGQPGLPDYWVCGNDDCPGGKRVVVHELAPASKFVFPLVEESALVYATDERVSYSQEREWIN